MLCYPLRAWDPDTSHLTPQLLRRSNCPYVLSSNKTWDEKSLSQPLCKRLPPTLQNRISNHRLLEVLSCFSWVPQNSLCCYGDGHIFKCRQCSDSCVCLLISSLLAQDGAWETQREKLFLHRRPTGKCQRNLVWAFVFDFLNFRLKLKLSLNDVFWLSIFSGNSSSSQMKLFIGTD